MSLLPNQIRNELKITVADEGVGCWVSGVGLRSENPKPKTQNLKPKIQNVRQLINFHS
jgi:hypothetical protein